MATTPKDGGERDPAQDETEFDRFRSLARKLVRVPKHEVDAEQAKEKAHREGDDRD